MEAAADPARPHLETRELRKSFKGRRVVDGISIGITAGEIVGLLGPNGAGKTTTFSMVVGLVRPDGGGVFLNDDDVTALPMYRRARRGIGYLPQEPSIFRRMNVEDNVLAVLETTDLSRAERIEKTGELLEEFGLTRLAKSRGDALSGGERRRAEIARCLALDPDFVLLDEPFAGIDPIAVLDIRKLVRALAGRGIGVLITDHNAGETLKITDRAYIIAEGRIFRAGSPAQLAADAEVRRVYLGEEFRLE
jgi:lipopolysaccharide export system ATP-binding protein